MRGRLFLTEEETASALKKSRGFVIGAIARGDLPAWKSGSSVLIPAQAIWLLAHGCNVVALKPAEIAALAHELRTQEETK